MSIRNMQLINRDECEYMKDKKLRMFDCKNCSQSKDCEKLADNRAARKYYIAQEFNRWSGRE